MRRADPAPPPGAALAARWPPTLPKRLLAGLAAATFVAAAQPAADAERGRQLADGLAACGMCHSPRTADGKPDRSRWLIGGRSTLPSGAVLFPGNLTPDADTGLGRWSDDDIIAAIRQGKRPDGSRITFMPVAWYAGMADADVRDIVAYLRGLPPQRSEPARASPAASAASAAAAAAAPAATPPVPPLPALAVAPPASDRAAYGRYLATSVAFCMACHSGAQVPATPADLATAEGSGGRRYGPSVASNLTPHDSGLGPWSDADIERAIRHGLRPDGRRLQPPMPVSHYERATPEQVQAIIAYLRSLRPLPLGGSAPAQSGR